jgi:hypothetical protein
VVADATNRIITRKIKTSARVVWVNLNRATDAQIPSLAQSANHAILNFFEKISIS